jgi:hypothetical protein
MLTHFVVNHRVKNFLIRQLGSLLTCQVFSARLTLCHSVYLHAASPAPAWFVRGG